MDYKTKFHELIKKQKAYIYMLQLAGWDSQTEAPRESFARRAEMVGMLSGEFFKLSIDKEYQEVVNALNDSLGELDDLTKREVKKAKKQLDKIVKIPENEFVEYQSLLQMAQQIWEDAKAKNDYPAFKDTLAEIIVYTKKFVSYYKNDDHPYNVLLDEFEEGMTMEDYDKFFDALKKDLVPFVKTVLSAKDETNYEFLDNKYDIEKQKEFCDNLIDVFHFNRDRGLMKKSVHPFTWNTSPTDVRFTTRYHEDMVFSSIYAVIHELGHATYEQQIDTMWDDTVLNGGTSMGIHESQSRFYENIIGRSLEFWEVNYPKLRSLFPEQLHDVNLNMIHKGVNKVASSLIRVEADELTYPMHIMIRYEIERMLMTGETSVDNLPEIWNQKMVEYLGIKPNNDGEGVLQDVHWSAGMIGYFPTYALGSAYSAQFYHAMKKDFDVVAAIKANDIKKINDWLKEKIHKYGSSKTPKELLLEVTGESFNPQYYIDYLKEKYSKLYL